MLCSTAKGHHRQTCYKCASCEVPLCRTSFDKDNANKNAVTCFELWYNTPKENLKDICKAANNKVAEFQSRKRKRAQDPKEQYSEYDGSIVDDSMSNDADVPPLPQTEFRNNIDAGVGSTSPVMLPAACKTLVVGSNVDNQDDWSDDTPTGK